jgi:NAD(P)-dependent dehydrogenase (short-subunit alcohol dehydrogenase family)
MQIADSVALVTGGASGLGLAAVRRLHDAGACVVILDLASSEGPAIAESMGERVAFVAGDVTDEGSVQAAVDRAVEMGPLRIAVNCAGVAPASRTVKKDHSPASAAKFDRVVQINLVGTWNVVRIAAAAMVSGSPIEDGERGVLVNTASIAAFDGQIGQAAYAASKAGVVGMTLPVARDLAQYKIRVMTVAPGLFLTPLVEGLPEKVVNALGAAVPHPARLGQPDEFAALVVHIVENAMLNGEVIRLDGAIRMQPK